MPAQRLARLAAAADATPGRGRAPAAGRHSRGRGRTDAGHGRGSGGEPGSCGGRSDKAHGRGAHGGGAGRGSQRSQQHRMGNAGQQRQGGRGRGRVVAEQPLTLEAWLRRAERLDSAGKGGALVALAQDLERVPACKAVASSARAVRAVEVILERACACKWRNLPPFLGVFTRALEQHPGRMGRAQQSNRFTRNTRALLEQAGSCEATYAHPKNVSQLAVAQQRLGITVRAYWQRLAAAMPPNFGGRQVANVYHAYAALVAQGMQADVSLCAELERLAATTAAEMIAQEVANVMWAAATVRAQSEKRANAMRVQTLSHEAERTLCQAAERVAAQMNSRDVSITLWALAVMGEAPPAALSRALLDAAERVALDMNPQTVANTLWALATLGVAPHAGLKQALCAAAERAAPAMVPQEVANTLWAPAKLRVDPTLSLKRALCNAAERVTVAMVPQDIANTLWAFAKLGEAPAPGVLAALLEAAQRTAPEMAALEVSSTLLSLALLQEPLHGGLRAALRAAVQAKLPDMNAQSLANLLFAAAAWFHLDQGAAVLPTEATFSALAGFRTDLKLEECTQVHLQYRKVACARNKCVSEYCNVWERTRCRFKFQFLDPHKWLAAGACRCPDPATAARPN
jgi:hypothetical protein